LPAQGWPACVEISIDYDHVVEGWRRGTHEAARQQFLGAWRHFDSRGDETPLTPATYAKANLVWGVDGSDAANQRCGFNDRVAVDCEDDITRGESG
jgi:hypothetical protein